MVRLCLYLSGPVHAPAGEPGKAVAASGSVQVVGPIEFGCRITVACFFEQTPANLVADERFGSRCAGKTQGFFMQPGRLVPLVAALIGLGNNEQGPEPVPGRCQQCQSFVEGFFLPSENGQDPHPFQFRAVPSRASMASRSRTTSRSVAGSMTQISSLAPAPDNSTSALIVSSSL